MTRTYRTGTALAASLSLLLPHAGGFAQAQGASGQSDVTGPLFCIDGATPPCAQEPQSGTPLLELPIEALQALAEAGELDDALLAPFGLSVELLGEGTKKEIRQALKAARQAERRADRKAERQADGSAEAETDAADAQAEADVQAEAETAKDARKDARKAEKQAELEAAAEAETAAESEQAKAEKAARKAARKAEKQAEVEAAAEAETAAESEQAKAEKAARKAEKQAELEAAAEAEAAAESEQAEADMQAEAEAEAAKDARKAEKQAALEAEAEAEATAEAEAQAEAQPKLTPEERAERRAKRAARRAERRAQAEQDEVDPTANEPQEAVAAASSAEAQTASEVTETEIDEENSRQSDEEFEASVGADAGIEADEDDDGLSNFQKALLVGIGAVAVGSLLNNGREVVANTGDRVVVEGDDGLEIYRDDDALLRQPGADLRTETFSDGSTRSTLTREDGTQVVTIRNAEGRVLRRSRIFADGTEVELFDDLAQSEPVDVRSLREMEPEPVTVSASDREALLAALRAEQVVDTGRSYSLRQVREIQAVRALVPAIDLDTLTFDTGSAALRPEQAGALVDLGLLIEDRLAENPREVFLIEGHTDAVGDDAYNLALSDRRAETVALALTETFDIPPENLVVQGYGERYLKVNSEQSVEANRRATVRRITPLLQQVASAQ